MFRVVNENRGMVYSGLVFIVCYALLSVIAMQPDLTFDTFWHLQMGKDFLVQGLSPWVDHYSFSYPGKEISSVPVIFQTMLYQFVSFFGESGGFYFIKLFYITLLMLVLFAYFRKIKANSYIVFILLPIIVGVITPRLIVRPEIFSNVLVVICLVLYLNAQKKFATKELLVIVLLLLFWKSYHSPVIGYIIIFGLFLEKAINKLIHKDESFSWTQWLIWGAVIFLTGFINLNGEYLVGQHFIVGMMHTMTAGFSQYIVEYNDSYQYFSTNILVNVSWFLSVYVAIWSLVKKQYGFAFIVVLLTCFSWLMVRLVSLTLLVNLCILALYFTQVLSSEYWLQIRTSVKKTLLIVAVCLSVWSIFSLAKNAYAIIELDKNKQLLLEQQYPIQVADYLKHYQAGGNVLNVMQHGSYLINKLPPDYKIYYDGRVNILYPIDFVIHNYNLWRDAQAVDEVLERYDISYVLRENTPKAYAFLKKIKRLEPSFADDNYLLFTKSGDGAFPLASMLLAFPLCWNDDFSQDIQREIALSEKLFENKQYTIKGVLEFMKSYLSEEDKQKFFSALQFEKRHSDGVRRIAFYLAMKNTDGDTVSGLFASIGLKNNYDLLLYSYYLAKKEEYEEAEKLAYHFYSLAKAGQAHVTYDKLGILARILRVLKEHNKLHKFELSYIADLEDSLEKVNYPFDRELSFNFMCK